MIQSGKRATLPQLHDSIFAAQRETRMKTIEFYMTREEIGERIFATSAYTARAREAMGTPPAITERMQATADDTALLNPIMDNSASQVTAFIVHYHPGSNVEYSNDEYRFTVQVPENYPAGNGDKLKQAIVNYIVNSTLKEWYTNVKPDEAAIMVTKTQNDAVAIEALLTQRERPTK